MAQLRDRVAENPALTPPKPPVLPRHKSRWHSWGGKSPVWGLFFVSLIISIVVAVPLIYIAVRAITAEEETRRSLWAKRIPELLFNTLSLAIVVTIGATVLGIVLGWLIARTDIPGHKWLKALLAMPLAVPPYVGALTYITTFDHSGLAEQFSFGLYDLKLGQRSWVYGFGGAAVVLILFCFPYVYLNVLAALSRSNRSLDEAARGLGLNSWQTFWRVHLPLLRPAASAGALVVAFYLLSEFGVVSLLRYDTFTTVIFRQLATRTDNNATAILSTVLVFLTLLILWGETRAQGKTAYWQVSGHWKPAQRKALGVWKIPSLIFVGLVLFASLFLPLLVLGYWFFTELTTKNFKWDAMWGYGLNSLWSAAVAATVALVLALPVAYLFARYKGIFGKLPAILTMAGNALPGVVVALSMIFLFNGWFPALYGTIVVLLVAYVVRFIPLTVQAGQAAIRQTTENLEEAGHSLGCTKMGVLWRIVLPLSRPGFIAGWVVFFMTVIRELPATLALRPIGFDTLSVRIWMETSEGFYGRASLPSLLLIIISVIPLFFIITKSKDSSKFLH